MNLCHKKILVAGASSGIGRAAAVMISKLGGKVVLNGRSQERLDETRSMMEGEGHFVMPYDLLQGDGIKQYIKSCVEIDGTPFDGLVFSAGTAGRAATIHIERMEEIKRVMEMNFFTYAALLKEFSSKRVLRNGGAIVALSSCITTHWDKSTFAYACSKSALEAASSIASREFAARNIRVNSVCPEMTNTPMVKSFFQNVPLEQRNIFYPLGALTPEDVANTIVFLLSDRSSKITGQKFYLSAGNDGRPIEYII